MKNYVAIAISVLVFSTHGAAKPLIQAKRSPLTSYKAYVDVSTQYESLTHFQLKRRPARSQVKKLNQLFLKAKKSYLKQPLSVAKKKFARVTELHTQAGWKKPQRKILQHSYMRQAQMSSQKSRREMFFRKAFAVDPELSVNPKRFPPPLIQQWQEGKKQIKKIAIKLGKRFKGYEKLLINGKSHNLRSAKKVQLPTGEKYRLTLISNKLAPVTKIISAKKAASWSPPRQVLAKGNCENPKSSSSKAIFYSTDCIHKKGATSETSPKTSSNPPLPPSPPVPSPQKLSFLKSRWFWGLISAVAAGVMIHNNRPEDEPEKVKEPKTTRGFGKND